MPTTKLKKIGRSLVVLALAVAVASLLSPANALATSIARDSSASFSATGSGGSSTATQGYTNNGTFLELTFRNNTDNGDFVTSVTYGGVAMTLGQKSQAGSFNTAYDYYILNPATGANNLSINYSGATQAQNYVGVVASYSGVGSVDATLFTTDASCASNTHSVTPTKVNEWVILAELNVDANPTASTGAVLNKIGVQSGIFDSNGTVTANNAYSMTITVSGGTRIGMWSMISVAPPVAATVSPWQFQDF